MDVVRKQSSFMQFCFFKLETNFAQTRTQFSFKSYVYSEPSDSVFLLLCLFSLCRHFFICFCAYTVCQQNHGSLVSLHLHSCWHREVETIEESLYRVWATHIWIRQQRSRIEQRMSHCLSALQHYWLKGRNAQNPLHTVHLLTALSFM